MENAITSDDKTGEIPGPRGSRHPSIAPFQAFQASDAYLAIAAGNDHLFSQMAKTLGEPGLVSDPRFTTNELRHENIDALEAAMEKPLSTNTVTYWLDALNNCGVPCGPINDIRT